MRINEIFDSWEGEGRDVGIQTTFVRLQGCILEPHCKWCDTPNAWDTKRGYELSVGEVLKQCRHNRILITGGEPLLQLDEVKRLVKKLRGKRVVIETSGLYDFLDFPERVKIVADLKTPSSGVKMSYDYVRSLSEKDDLVAVCKTPEDVVFAKDRFTFLRGEGCFACYFFSFDVGSASLISMLEDFNDSFFRIQTQLHKVLDFR